MRSGENISSRQLRIPEISSGSGVTRPGETLGTARNTRRERHQAEPGVASRQYRHEASPSLAAERKQKIRVSRLTHGKRRPCCGTAPAPSNCRPRPRTQGEGWCPDARCRASGEGDHRAGHGSDPAGARARRTRRDDGLSARRDRLPDPTTLICSQRMPRSPRVRRRQPSRECRSTRACTGGVLRRERRSLERRRVARASSDGVCRMNCRETQLHLQKSR